MRVVLFGSATLLAGCAAARMSDPVAVCQAQGYAAGTEEYRVCLDAGGVAVATGPGSPYANVDAEDSP